MKRRSDFIIRRFAFSILTLIAIIIFNFLLFRILPGDPVQMTVSPRMLPEAQERVRQQFGLDKPLWLNFQAAGESGDVRNVLDSQFFHYVKSLAQGDMGESFRLRQPVADLIGQRLGPSLLLIFTGELVAVLAGTTLGLIAAWKKGSSIETFAMSIGLTAWALPAFWLGILLLIVSRGSLPMGGFSTPGAIHASNWHLILDVGRHLALPATTLALWLFGGYMLIVRNSALEVLSEDYILAAKAKGLSPFRVLRSHVLKNASLPLVTIIGIHMGLALAGIIQIESIFSWPGLGRLMFDSIAQRDFPVLQGAFLVLAVGVIAANFLADLSYTALDPRVKE